MFSDFSDTLWLIFYFFILFGMPIVFLIATLVSARRKNPKPVYLVIFIISLSFSIGYMFLSQWTINGYVNEDYSRAIVDVLKVSNDSGKCFYLTQPYRGGAYNKKNTLHIADRKTDKKIVLAEGVVDIFITNDDNFVYTDGRDIKLYNVKNGTEKVLLTERYISSISGSPKGDYIVFTTWLSSDLAVNDVQPYYYTHAILDLPEVSSYDSFKYYQDNDEVVGGIYLYNTKTAEVKPIPFDKKYGNYPLFPSVSEDNKVIFSVYNNILSYNIDTDKSSFVTNGRWPKISENGKYIVFRDSTRALEGQKFYDVYRYDLINKERRLVSKQKNGENDMFDHGIGFTRTANISSHFMDISADGMTIAYSTTDYGKERLTPRSVSYYSFKTGQTKTITPPEINENWRENNTFTIALSDNGKYLLYSGYGTISKKSFGVRLMDFKNDKVIRVK